MAQKQDADLLAAAEWKVSTPASIVDEFQPHDIFSGDETARFYQGFLDKRPWYAVERDCRRQKAMDCITLLLWTNMDRMGKWPLMVIGKSKSPL